MKLTDLQSGKTGTVSKIDCGHGIKRKLSSRGVKQGCRVKMVSSSRGPVVFECGGSQMAIGRGMAKKIKVRRE